MCPRIVTELPCLRHRGALQVGFVEAHVFRREANASPSTRLQALELPKNSSSVWLNRFLLPTALAVLAADEFPDASVSIAAWSASIPNAWPLLLAHRSARGSRAKLAECARVRLLPDFHPPVSLSL